MRLHQKELRVREASLLILLVARVGSPVIAQTPVTPQPVMVTVSVGTTQAALPASDSLRLTLLQAKELFKQHNLNLLTAPLGISESHAQQIQVKLRPNPVVYAEIMPYNNGIAYASAAADAGKKRFLRSGQSNSEQVVRGQQLLLMAGKRDKQLALARTTTEIARDRFSDVVRTLTYQLRSTFYALYYNQQSVTVYDQEIDALRQIVMLFQQQFDKGNVPLKNLARLKAYLFDLTSECQQLVSQLTNAQFDMTVLLNINPATLVKPLVSTNDTANYSPSSLSINTLYELAEQNRYDLKAYTDQASLEQQNLVLQKAIAVSDLTLQESYDRNDSFGQNYVGVAMPILIANKNQGVVI